MFFKIINPDILKVFDMIQYIFLIWEVSMNYDYSIGNHIIADWSGFTFSTMKSMEPNYLHKFFMIYQVLIRKEIICCKLVNIFCLTGSFVWKIFEYNLL